MTQAGQDATELLQKRGDVEKQIEALEKEVAQLGEEVENTVRQIGNIVHASVPVSDNEVRSLAFFQLCSSALPNEKKKKFNTHTPTTNRTTMASSDAGASSNKSRSTTTNYST
jgi:seryl-tRNA synthetase